MHIFMATVTQVPGRTVCVYVTAKNAAEATYKVRRVFNDWYFKTGDHSNPWVKMDDPDQVPSFASARDQVGVPLGCEVLYSPTLLKRRLDDAKRRVKDVLPQLRLT